VVQEAVHLPSRHKTLRSNPSTTKKVTIKIRTLFLKSLFKKITYFFQQTLLVFLSAKFFVGARDSNEKQLMTQRASNLVVERQVRQCNTGKYQLCTLE
jgi:hypothetical protein